MARVLTAAHASVRSRDVPEYVATLGQLAARLGARGQHLWLFRARYAADQFIEFAEGRDDAGHRSHGPADGDEAALEVRLQGLARYSSGHDVRWDEVPLTPRAEA